jgi:hypothetical protein
MSEQKPAVDVQRTWRKFGWLPKNERLAIDSRINTLVAIFNAHRSAKKALKNG